LEETIIIAINRTGRGIADAVCLGLTIALMSVEVSNRDGLLAQAPARSLAIGGRANANVSLAASGQFVSAVWSGSTKEGVTDIYSAVSRDGGLTFGTPTRVNSKPGDARVNGEQPPRVALGQARGGVPEITVMWTSRAGHGTVLLTSRSSDGGKSFSSTRVVSGTDASGNRGWEAIGVDVEGGIHAVWLDHRRMAPKSDSVSDAAHHHATSTPGERGPAAGAASDGAAMAQQSDLYFETFGDGAVPRAITAGVCYCCKTALAFGASGEVYLAWRHVYPGNLRDIAFAASRDRGRTFTSPVRVSQDNWMLEGCPDDGPAMQVDREGRIHIVWPAVIVERSTPVKALFHAVSTDGRSFSPRTRIPTEGHANHPQLVVGADGTLLLAWDESGDGSRKIVFGRGVVDKTGIATFTRVVSREPGTYPVVATTPAGAVLAWTAGDADSSTIRLTQIR
jgi:hypothetical protein